MDALNLFCRERGLDRPLRIQLREFLREARRVNQLSDDAELLDKFSPLMQGKIAIAANHACESTLCTPRCTPNSMPRRAPPRGTSL